RLECLEPRHLLSMDLPPGISAVRLEPLPAPLGSSQKPVIGLVISFDQAAIDAIGFDFATLINEIDNNTDFQLDGPLGTVFGFSGPPAEEDVTSNGTETDVSIPISDSLPAGTYQVSVNGGTTFDFFFSQAFALSTDQ